MIVQPDLHDSLDQTMFWTGAMFAFTPVFIAAIVLAVWWRGHKRVQAQKPPSQAPEDQKQV